MNGAAALRAQIELLESLPARLLAEAPPLVAVELEKEIRANIAAGRDPDGAPWAKTQAGAVPLRNAGKALTVKAMGSVVLAKLVGPEARHHLGTAAGKIRRQILPTKRVPRSMTLAIKRVLAKKFNQIVSGENV